MSGLDLARVRCPHHGEFCNGDRCCCADTHRAYEVNDLSQAPDSAFRAMLARVDSQPWADEAVVERLADRLALELDSLGISGEMTTRAAEYLAEAALDSLRPAPATTDGGENRLSGPRSDETPEPGTSTPPSA